MQEIPHETARLDRLARRAALVLAWEQLWPGLAAALALVGVFLALSWLGLWLELPRLARIAGVTLFAAALAAILARLLLASPASRKARLARLDRDSGQAHRPASALADTLANAGGDPATRALWALHRARLAQAARRLRLKAPAPRLAQKDRFALRGAALLAVVAAAFVAGPERGIRLAAAFDWRAPALAGGPGFRADAWIDPPAYTGRAPVLLDLRQPDAAAAALTAIPRIDAPVNSTLVARATGEGAFKVETQGALEAIAAPEGESRLALRGDGRAILRRDGAVIASFDLHAIPDLPPTIALTEPPLANVRGSLTLSYKIGDDYGVASAEASFASPMLRGKPLPGRSLAVPPRLGLTLPPGAGGIGAAQTTGDLSEHPWAGAKVMLTLTARDEGGNAGTSAPQELVLPAHPFSKPLARALAEQRRSIVLGPDDTSKVGLALEALMLAPERFATTAGIYLGLRTAARQLEAARTDPELLAVSDFLWEMALRIEDGDLSGAERDLRAAEQALREALQRGAGDEEIKKLMADVRAALDKFLKELAEKQLRENGEPQQNAQNQRNGKLLTPQDLKSMMDRIEEMAKSGNLAEAQRMLDQMQKMLENLRTAKRRAPSQQRQEMNKALNELDAMAKEQQNLRDDTFRREQRAKRKQQAQKGQRPPPGGQTQKGQKGAQPQQGQPGGEEDAQDDASDTGDAQSAEESQQALKDRQQALRDRLESLQKRLKQQGQNGDDGLGDADEAMKDAESALGEGQGQGGKASEAQGRAIESLRRGAQKLAQAMQQQGGEGEGTEQADDEDGGEDTPGQRQGNSQGRNRDPLGRENDKEGKGNNARGLNENGVPAAQRAQQVLEELRRRLGDTARPRDELDYLERLLKRY